MVELMLGSPFPAAIAWGPELTVIYNDGFDAIDNFSDPPPLGRPFTKVWPKPESDGIVDSIRQGQARQIIDRYWDLPARTERPFGWFTSQWTPLRDEAGGFAGFYLAAFETTDRVLVERALLEREEQQAFVLGLSDALRPLADPLEVQAVACRLLGEHLQADYTYYLNLYEAEGFAIIAQDFARAGLPSRAGKYPLSLVGWAMPHQGQGQPIAITDVQTSPLVPDDCRERVLADRVVSLLGIPLAKQGRLVGALALSMTTPREWTPAEIALATEIGERTWAAMERARAEKTAREADIRLRTLADAAPVLIWDADSSGTILVNDHYLDFFGVSFEAVAGYGWQKFLHPEDAERHLSLFQEAFAQRHCFTDEARLRRADGQYRWLSTSGRPLEDGRFVGVSIDVTERRLAEQRVRRNNAVLQAINLVFSETLGASSEEELARISLEVAEELTGSAIGFIGEINETTGRLDGLFFSDRSRARYAAHASEGDDGFPMGKSALGLAIHGIYGRVLQDGAGVIVNDPASHPDRVGTPAGHLPLTAFLGVPLKQGDRTRGLIGLGNRPGGYRPEDLEAAEALAPAIWHALRSKRAELRLRESEERFRQFAEASSDVLWIRDAETFEMEFVSPALRTVYGIEPNVLGPEIRRWAGHMLPEDRENALQNLQRAATGQSLLNEFRIKRPSDGAFRWIRSTLFPLRDEQGRVRRIGGLSSDMTEAKLLIGHQAVLLAELQHRVRNIMAVTRSIVARTGERAETVSDYASLVGGRLLTLARVQALLTRSPNAGVPVATIVRDEIDAQDLRADQYDLSGPKIELSPKAAEILTLAVHELATNALKYGALSVPDGRVRVNWSSFEKRGEPWLGFDWAEDGVSEAKIADEREANRRTGARRGFGRELIEGRLPYELGGRGRLEIGPEGARCRLEFPLRDGASILETDAPQRATVFGGALDMTGEPDLSGYRILVVEDDYYLATDTARALQGAGAEVVGPCPSEEAAREALDEGALAAALVDINLGSGPSFTLAALLRERGVPFVFITGYDEGVIPPDFADVERLQKPVELKRVVNFLADTLQAAQ